MTGNYETGGLEIGAEVNSWGGVGVGYVRTVVNEETGKEIRSFVAERDWSQFHTPENLAKSISIEAAELLECYQWDADADVARVREELADVVTYSFMLADRLGLDLDEIVLAKLAKTREKYPVELSKGRSTKYDAL